MDRELTIARIKKYLSIGRINLCENGGFTLTKLNGKCGAANHARTDVVRSDIVISAGPRKRRLQQECEKRYQYHLQSIHKVIYKQRSAMT